jgi:hypothetical protein
MWLVSLFVKNKKAYSHIRIDSEVNLIVLGYICLVKIDSKVNLIVMEDISRLYDSNADDILRTKVVWFRQP